MTAGGDPSAANRDAAGAGRAGAIDERPVRR